MRKKLQITEYLMSVTDYFFGNVCILNLCKTLYVHVGRKQVQVLIKLAVFETTTILVKHGCMVMAKMINHDYFAQY